VRLETYYIHPQSTPTRAALLTGRYGHNVGLNADLHVHSPFGLSSNYTTLADVLRPHGFYSVAIGKVRRPILNPCLTAAAP